MDQGLGSDLTEYIRHYLMREGSLIKQSDVYYALKDNVTVSNAEEYMVQLYKYSIYYQRLLKPDLEPELSLRKCLERLKKLEVTTTYPFLLSIYGEYDNSGINLSDFTAILETLENFLIRRFVCSVPTNQLNKIFPVLYPQLKQKYPRQFLVGVREILQSKGYPKDNEFYHRFKEAKFYGGGDRQNKTKFILESIEENYNHKESVLLDQLTIEHVMPQTLSDWWRTHLGDECDEVHELYLHTIGNLTLTGYNSELSNSEFNLKRKILIESNLELNKYFTNVSKWTNVEIEHRSDAIAKNALSIWEYFGSDRSDLVNSTNVTGTTPVKLQILGQVYSVASWREVLVQTFNTIADLEPDKFNVIAVSYPKYLTNNNSKLRDYRRLQNGWYIEVNLSAKGIQKLCYQALQTADLTADDWLVETF